MAIEIETKKSSKSSFFINFLFYLSIILLIGSAATFFVLNHLENKAEEKIKNTEKELEKLTGEEMERLESKLKNIEVKTSNYEDILNNKKIASKAVPFVEEICHPKVQLNSAKLGAEGANRIVLTGKAESYEVLEQQLMILRNERRVNSLSLDQIKKSSEGGISFEISASVSSSIFYQNK